MLYLYLAVSPTTVSSLLIREERKTQMTIYYTSRALRGAEERYPPMEKLSFALIVVARKLQPYFQPHSIVVLTNHPLHKEINNPNTGSLVQWVVELSEFDIDYKPRTMIKAQALADFIVEFTTKDDEPKVEEDLLYQRWKVSIEGSSTKNTGGVGVVLESLEGGIINHATRLQ